MSEQKVKFDQVFEPFRDEPIIPLNYPWYSYDAPIVGEDKPFGCCSKLYEEGDSIVIMPPTCDSMAIVMNRSEWAPHSKPMAMNARAIAAIDNDVMNLILAAVVELPRHEQKEILELAVSQSDPDVARTALARIISSDSALEHLYSEPSA